MTRWTYWFHLAALAATTFAFWRMRGADWGKMGEFHKQGTAEGVAAWMETHKPLLSDLDEWLRADMYFLFCYPLLFVSMAALAGDAPSVALAAIAAVGAGIADYIETSKGRSILRGGGADQAAAMAKASIWKWRLFGFAALLTARTLYGSAGFEGHRAIAHALAFCFLLVSFMASGSKPMVAALSCFAAAVTLAVAR
ncbi:MAG: hypothetical protein FJW32_14765 [Acidobacteria bacterium]|nr:hypothetical protein [Acidobacteriota bacterium]